MNIQLQISRFEPRLKHLKFTIFKKSPVGKFTRIEGSEIAIPYLQINGIFGT